MNRFLYKYMTEIFTVFMIQNYKYTYTFTFIYTQISSPQSKPYSQITVQSYQIPQ